MRKIIFIKLALLILIHPFVFGQSNNEVITEHEACRIINLLSNDSLKGRGNGRPELLRAGIFIGDEFRRYGLKPYWATPVILCPSAIWWKQKLFRQTGMEWKELLNRPVYLLSSAAGNYA
jgi:hypothetical protein